MPVFRAFFFVIKTGLFRSVLCAEQRIIFQDEAVKRGGDQRLAFFRRMHAVLAHKALVILSAEERQPAVAYLAVGIFCDFFVYRGIQLLPAGDQLRIPAHPTDYILA